MYLCSRKALCYMSRVRVSHAIISSERAIDHTNPEGMLPLNDPEPFAE